MGSLCCWNSARFVLMLGSNTGSISRSSVLDCLTKAGGVQKPILTRRLRPRPLLAEGPHHGLCHGPRQLATLGCGLEDRPGSQGFQRHAEGFEGLANGAAWGNDGTPWIIEAKRTKDCDYRSPGVS
jgi:hypothetical protein